MGTCEVTDAGGAYQLLQCPKVTTNVSNQQEGD